jgi:hypothetical protein
MTEAERKAAAALLRRLPLRARVELVVGTVQAEGNQVNIVALSEVDSWLEGLAVRLESGADL